MFGLKLPIHAHFWVVLEGYGRVPLGIKYQHKWSKN